MTDTHVHHHHKQHQPRNEHTDHGAYDKHEGHSPGMFRDKFWLSFLLTLPVVFWSGHIQELLRYQAPEFPGSDWIPPVLGTVVFLYGGWVFVQGALHELKARLPGMMTLIALAISVAFVFSWVVQLGLIYASALWWELATLVTIMLLGHWIEMRSIDQARGALKELAKLLPDTATRITDGGEEAVPVSKLRDGDLVLVRPGESIPADGVVRRGSSDVNEAMITGESRPVKKGEGDEVIAGTINGEGSLRVEVTGTGEDTKLSRIMRLVGEAQQSKSRAQHLADRAAQSSPEWPWAPVPSPSWSGSFWVPPSISPSCAWRPFSSSLAPTHWGWPCPSWWRSPRPLGPREACWSGTAGVLRRRGTWTRSSSTRRGPLLLASTASWR